MQNHPNSTENNFLPEWDSTLSFRVNMNRRLFVNLNWILFVSSVPVSDSNSKNISMWLKEAYSAFPPPILSSKLSNALCCFNLYLTLTKVTNKNNYKLMLLHAIFSMISTNLHHRLQITYRSEMDPNQSSSSKADRKTIEKNRRTHMKGLYTELGSLIPRQNHRVRPLFHCSLI